MFARQVFPAGQECQEFKIEASNLEVPLASIKYSSHFLLCTDEYSEVTARR
jgi:hypothetical protein